MRQRIALGWAILQISVGFVGILTAPMIGAAKGWERGAFDAAVALGVLLVGIGQWRDAR